MRISKRLAAQRGVTLVELMVALVIGLIISLVAATLYLATQDTARTTRSFTDINETGKFALDMIGRELEKAGFYPAEFETATTGAAVSEEQVGQYVNIKNPGGAASVVFDQGLFGCAGAKFSPSPIGCGAKDPTQPADSIVVNYFASTEFGANAIMGNTNDCNRQPVSADPANSARAAAHLPLLVSNRYALTPQNLTQPDGTVITTNVLGCQGNGNDADTSYKPLLQGIDDMVITYGVYTDSANQSAAKFSTADALAAADWQRVGAVRLCIVVRSLENARQPDKAGSARVKPNCRGSSQTLASTDHYIYKRFEQVFAIRNNLTDLL